MNSSWRTVQSIRVTLHVASWFVLAPMLNSNIMGQMNLRIICAPTPQVHAFALATPRSSSAHWLFLFFKFSQPMFIGTWTRTSTAWWPIAHKVTWPRGTSCVDCHTHRIILPVSTYPACWPITRARKTPVKIPNRKRSTRASLPPAANMNGQVSEYNETNNKKITSVRDTYYITAARATNLLAAVSVLL